MNDDRSVSEESTWAGDGGWEGVVVGGDEGVGGEVTVLSREITDLACLWESWVAERNLLIWLEIWSVPYFEEDCSYLAAYEGIQMCLCCSAVSVLRNWINVQMVH